MTEPPVAEKRRLDNVLRALRLRRIVIAFIAAFVLQSLVAPDAQAIEMTCASEGQPTPKALEHNRERDDQLVAQLRLNDRTKQLFHDK